MYFRQTSPGRDGPIHQASHLVEELAHLKSKMKDAIAVCTVAFYCKILESYLCKCKIIPELTEVLICTMTNYEYEIF